MTTTAPAARADRLFDVSGRSYVVTGAASGLGAAIAEALIANGAVVLLIDRDADALDSVVARLGTTATGRAVDVADSSALRTAIEAFSHEHHRIDGLFANAGISGGPGFGISAGAMSGRLQEQDAEHWERILEVNLLGVLHSLQAVVPMMKRARRGTIVITASVAGIQAEPFVSYSYAAAKAATIQVVRQAALELAPFGIRVNAIAPGFVRTGIAGGRLHDPTVEADLAARIPLGRLGAPDEVQGLALLLASDAGSYLTGGVIPVDGGVLLGRRDPVDLALDTSA